MSSNTILVGLVLAALAGCTSRTPQAIPAPKVGAQGHADAGTVEVPFVLNQQDLKAYDTTNMSYKFSYLTASQSDKIEFVNGTATLTFKNLPAEQSGTMLLEIFEGSVFKLRGATENVILKKGQNNVVNLKLMPVQPGELPSGGANPSSTDLQIDVTLDNGNPGGSPAPTPQAPAPAPTPAPTPAPGPAPTPTPVDPVADWDGKSFKGNDRWTIVPVQ